MRLDLAFVNGKILPAESPAISPLDSGFQQGIGIYETLSVLGGKPVFLREHLERMEISRRFMKIPLLRWNIAESVAALLTQTGAGDAGLRITLSMGTAGGPTLAITLRAIPPVPNPLRLWISSHRKLLGDPFESIKTTSRARNAVAREEAIEKGAFEALLPTTEGDLAEGSVSNLFLLRDGSLATPPLQRGCLPGVTRDKLLVCARELGIAVKEISVFPKDLGGAEEILVTNALIGLCPADEVIGHWARSHRPESAVVRRLQHAYRSRIEEHLRLPQTGPALQ